MWVRVYVDKSVSDCVVVVGVCAWWVISLLDEIDPATHAPTSSLLPPYCYNMVYCM